MKSILFIPLICSLWFALISSTVIAQSKLLDKIIAVVDDEPILLSDIDTRLSLIKRNTFVRSTSAVREQVLDELINEKLQINLANKLGILVTSEQVEQALQANLNRLSGSTATLTENDKVMLRKSIYQQMLIKSVQYQQVPQQITVSDEEIEKFLSSSEGKKILAPQYHLYHVLIDLSKTDKADELVTKLMIILRQDYSFAVLQQELAQYASVRLTDLGWNKQEDMSVLFADKVPDLQLGQVIQAVKRSSSIHLLKLNNKKTFTNSEIVLQRKVRHILLPAENGLLQLQNIRKAIITDKNAFDVLAAQHSTDTESAAKGGDLGWVSAEEMVPEFAKVMLATPLNALSKPFTTEFGWHILQVLDEREVKQDVEQKINLLARGKLLEKKFPQAVERWISNLKTQAYIEKKSM
jgi:peptidyl-prolyl cis-trans isomerase SurA